MIDKLVLGTAQLGLEYGVNNKLGKPSLETSFDILRTAFNKGIRFLDTAEAYGDSQRVIGNFLRENPEKRFKIITKLSARHGLKEEEFLAHIRTNCKILGINQLYGYMFHNYQSFQSSPWLYDKILESKKEGFIKHVGISLYDNSEILEITDNYKEFDFIQIPFNLLDNQLKRKEALLRAKEIGLSIHTRSVFLQGLFFKNIDDLPRDLKPLAPYLKVLESIKQSNMLQTELLALQYVLQKEYIDHVLIGVESTDQLLSNFRASYKRYPIPDKLVDEINVKQKQLLNPANWHLG